RGPIDINHGREHHVEDAYPPRHSGEHLVRDRIATQRALRTIAMERKDDCARIVVLKIWVKKHAPVRFGPNRQIAAKQTEKQRTTQPKSQARTTRRTERLSQAFNGIRENGLHDSVPGISSTKWQRTWESSRSV